MIVETILNTGARNGQSPRVGPRASAVATLFGILALRGRAMADKSAVAKLLRILALKGPAMADKSAVAERVRKLALRGGARTEKSS
jgi:hypothetical protein